MAKKAPHLVDKLAQRIGGEVERMSEGVAQHVSAELLDDNAEMSEPAFLEYWRAHWPDPQWRATMLERMGPNAFREAALKAFGAPAPEPVGKLAREGMAKRAVDRTKGIEAPGKDEPISDPVSAPLGLEAPGVPAAPPAAGY